MELRRKLSILADAAKYDASCASSGAKRAGRADGIGHATGAGICHSYTPDGRCVSLLKILLTNHCIYDCQYCVNRISSDVRRARFTVDEVVFITMEFYRRNYIEGLFLSSGVILSPDKTMEEMALVAFKLRTEQRYNGYIHLKAVPKASPEAIGLAGRYADRLSVNIELATEEDLGRLAPEKKLADVENTMSEIRSKWEAAMLARPAVAPNATDDPRRERAEAFADPELTKRRFAPSGQSTQMIVGATAATDAQLLTTASRLYDGQKLRRVYYSAFSPIPHADPRLPVAPPPLMREHRLYQADWLFRFYGFGIGELTTSADPNLPLDVDPKLAWAMRNRHWFPADVNRAGRERLLRVPGLGVRNVERILRSRRVRKLRLEDLQRLRVSLAKCRPFIVAADHNPAVRWLDSERLREVVAPRGKQLDLFASATEARSGEL